MHKSPLIEYFESMLLRPGVDAIPILTFVLDIEIWFGSAVIRDPIESQEGHVRFAHWSEKRLLRGSHRMKGRSRVTY